MAKGFNKALLIALGMIVVLVGINIFVMNAENIFDFDDLTLTHYSVDVTIDNSGKATIKERHELKFVDRGRDWWNYYKTIDTTGYHNSVFNISSLKFAVDGVNYPVFRDRVNADNVRPSYYAYQNNAYYNTNGSMIEIGVFMPDFTEGKRVIDIEYTIDNILIEGTDIATFYYKFVGEKNTIPIKKFDAEVNFGEQSRDTLRTWFHITGNGGIGRDEIVDGTKIKYTAENIKADTFAECRISLAKNDYYKYSYYNPNVSLDKVISEEVNWQKEDANKRLKQTLFLALDIVMGVIAIIVCSVIAIKDFVKKKRKEVIGAPIYLHEPPEGYKCEECMPIFHYYDDDDGWWSDSISATILTLVKKKYLTIIPGKNKKDTKVMITNVNQDELTSYEKIVMDMLNDASLGGAISMDDFGDWCKDKYVKAGNYFNDYKRAAGKRSLDDRLRRPGNSHKPSKRGITVYGVGVGLSLLVIFAFNPFYVFNILLGIAGIVMFLFDHMRFWPMPKAGEKLYADLKAFEKYMLDFSNFDKKTIPDLILWEDYLIWATAMGIADEVSKQLSIVYPEYKTYYMSEDIAGDFVFWYLFAPRIRVFNAVDMSHSINSSLNSITAIKTASTIKDVGGKIGGSGFGGGSFSGGGGGFGGGGMGAR